MVGPTSAPAQVISPHFGCRAILPTWSLIQAEGGIQQIQGEVNAGPSQALYGSLVTSTQQVLTWVCGRCKSKGGARWEDSQ